MTILCCTDFSPAARAAQIAAAELARARRTSVRLITVLDAPGAREVLAERAPSKVTEHFEGEERRLLAELEREAAPLRARATVECPLVVECAVLAGPPADAILAHAAQRTAALLVLGAVGKRGGVLPRLGSTTDRVAQRVRTPLLVVRDARPFEEWGAGKRPLRAMCGVDLSPTSDAALRWASELRANGACELHAGHVFWPPDVRERLQRTGLPIGAAEPEVARAVEAELRARMQSLSPLAAAIPLRAVGGLGRVAHHLIELGEQLSADLLVIGTHQRQGLERVWHGSVSRDVIASGPLNVVIVPV